MYGDCIYRESCGWWLAVWVIGCGYGCSMVVAKCLTMAMAICGCFEVVEWCLWVEIVYITRMCCMVK